jgi:hypothetical protein
MAVIGAGEEAAAAGAAAGCGESGFEHATERTSRAGTSRERFIVDAF